jgi:hypothetical protein
MRWFFLSSNQEQIPTSEEQFPALIAGGLVRPQTMVWREGMQDWVSLGEIRPELFQSSDVSQLPAPPPIPDVASPSSVGKRWGRQTKFASAPASMQPRSIRDVAAPLARADLWVKAVAAAQILGAAVALVFALFSGLAVLYRSWSNRDLEASQKIGGTCIFLLLVAAAVIQLWMGVCLLRGSLKIKNAERLGDARELASGLADLSLWFRAAAVILLLGVILLILTMALNVQAPWQLSAGTGGGASS